MLDVLPYLVFIWNILLTVHAALFANGYSEEEANKMIYNVCFERCFGFGGEIEEETSEKLEGCLNCSFSFLVMSFLICAAYF